eukprot:SAG25_NODE_1183_length_3668_cov_124.933875_3_plen_114_part_00
MALQVLVKEFVRYSALFLRTIEGKPTCPQYHKLDPYESPLVLCKVRQPYSLLSYRGASSRSPRLRPSAARRDVVNCFLVSTLLSLPPIPPLPPAPAKPPPDVRGRHARVGLAR